MDKTELERNFAVRIVEQDGAMVAVLPEAPRAEWPYKPGQTREEADPALAQWIAEQPADTEPGEPR